MEEGLFPSYMSANSADRSDLEEERRLAYVGITRAIDDLILTCARTRMIRGETQYNAVSRFVQEIPEEILEGGTSRRRKVQSPPAGDGAFRKHPESEVPMDKGAGGGGTPPFGRPKAIVRPTATAKADKPFIAKGIGSLNRLAGISKGGAYQAPQELSYAVGDRVFHVKYGDGNVVSIEKEPRDYKVTVSFDKAGQKIMYASFAKLKRL